MNNKCSFFTFIFFTHRVRNLTMSLGMQLQCRACCGFPSAMPWLFLANYSGRNPSEGGRARRPWAKHNWPPNRLICQIDLWTRAGAPNFASVAPNPALVAPNPALLTSKNIFLIIQKNIFGSKWPYPGKIYTTTTALKTFKIKLL